MNPRSLTLSALAGCLLALAPEAAAQRGSSGTLVKELPSPQSNLYPAGTGPGGRSQAMAGGARPAIMLTGYWPPSNEMLRPFSTDPVQNPGGWVGSNWEGRGYDVYAYFPEFPAGLGQGVGDLEVDYQDTSLDFWPLADNLKPIAVITFSRGSAGITPDWEVEMNNRNLPAWVNDYSAPFQPTPAPPDGSLAAGAVRLSTLPVQRVVDAVDVAHIPNLDAWICLNGNGGGFLSEFIAYHGVWYQALHASPTDPAWCVTAGHIHVGAGLGAFRARQATHQTLRAVMRYVDEVTGVTGGDTQWFCVPNGNSQTFGAILTATGSNSISQNDLELQVVRTVSGGLGLPFYAAAAQPSALLGDGNLCLSAPLYRLAPVILATTENTAFSTLDFNLPPLGGGVGLVTAGSTWQFQYMLRDPAAGGANFNLSSALAISFVP